jgi:capsular polysaccharide transport system permease protein
MTTLETRAAPRIAGTVARRRPFRRLLLSALVVIGLPLLAVGVWYGLLAPREYETTFEFAIRGPSQAEMGHIHTTTIQVGAVSPDTFLVSDYINSPQAVMDVGQDVNLRATFSAAVGLSWLSRSNEVTPEDMNALWKRMVSASYDLMTGNVTVSVRAFTPQDSLKLAQALIRASDKLFRRLNAASQQAFVRMADDNERNARKQLVTVQQALLAFRAKSGVAHPDLTSQASAGIVNDLRKQLADAQAQYSAMRMTTPNSPLLTSLKSQMTVLEAQIKKADRVDAATPVSAVTAKTLGEYQTLQADRETAERLYSEALALRYQAHLESRRQDSYLAMIVNPTLPQSPFYLHQLKTAVMVLAAAAGAWLALLLVYHTLLSAD